MNRDLDTAAKVNKSRWIVLVVGLVVGCAHAAPRIEQMPARTGLRNEFALRLVRAVRDQNAPNEIFYIDTDGLRTRMGYALDDPTFRESPFATDSFGRVGVRAAAGCQNRFDFSGGLSVLVLAPGNLVDPDLKDAVARAIERGGWVRYRDARLTLLERDGKLVAVVDDDKTDYWTPLLERGLEAVPDEAPAKRAPLFLFEGDRRPLPWTLFWTIVVGPGELKPSTQAELGWRTWSALCHFVNHNAPASQFNAIHGYRVTFDSATRTLVWNLLYQHTADRDQIAELLGRVPRDLAAANELMWDEPGPNQLVVRHRAPPLDKVRRVFDPQRKKRR